MADLDLRTDYKDDILDSSVNEKRIYNLVDSDGNIVAENVSLVDNSIYNQKGDSFGAVDINKTNQAVLALNQSLNEIGNANLLCKGLYTTETTVETSDNISNYKYLLAFIVQENGSMYNPSFIPRELFGTLFKTIVLNTTHDESQGIGIISYIDDTHVGLYRSKNWFPICLYGIK